MKKLITPLLFTLLFFDFLHSSDDELNPELAPLMMPPEMESMEYTMEMLDQWESGYNHTCCNEHTLDLLKIVPC